MRVVFARVRFYLCRLSVMWLYVCVLVVPVLSFVRVCASSARAFFCACVCMSLCVSLRVCVYGCLFMLLCIFLCVCFCVYVCLVWFF